MEEKECCKWCGNCVNTDLENNKGTCYLDIGEHIEDTENYCCSSFYFNADLDRS